MPSELEKARVLLGHVSMKPSPVAWLDTGFPDVNTVLGHHGKGLLYGEIIEVSGQNSTAKTALALILSAMGQKGGASITWVNVEGGRFDHEWAQGRGLDTQKNFHLVEPYVGTFWEVSKTGKKVLSDPRQSSAEELCAEAETVIKATKAKKQILVVDSIAAFETEYESDAGIEGQNLRTGQSLPMFLSRLMRRWVGMAQSRNVLVILLNQLRQNPMARFKDPWYTVGGNAIPYYAHVRVRMSRAKGGKMTHNGKMIGLQGVMENTKNKSGGFEGSKVGFKMRFNGPIEFLPVDQLKKETGDE